jgi:hypothetical protein
VPVEKCDSGDIHDNDEAGVKLLREKTNDEIMGMKYCPKSRKVVLLNLRQLYQLHIIGGLVSR